MAVLLPIPKFQAFTVNGDPLSGGLLYTYAAGTTTPQATYTNQGGGTANANPVELDSRGEANVWLDSALVYKLVLKDSAGATIWTVDNVGSTTSTISYTHSGTGAVARTLQNKLAEALSVKDFGATGDGVTNDTTAFTSARDAAGADGVVYVPSGDYSVTGLTFNVARQTWVFDSQATLVRRAGASGSTLSLTAAGIRIEGGKIDGNRSVVASGSGLDVSTAGTGCVIDGLQITDAKVYGMYIEGAGVVVRNCTVTSSEDIGIFVTQNLSADDTGPTITGCVIDQRALAASVLTGGIFLRGNATGPKRWLDGIVAQNRVYLTADPSVASVGVECLYCDRATVTANQVTGGYIGISIGNARDVAVDANVFYYQKQIGLEVAQASLDCVISNNLIDGNSLVFDGIELSSSATPSLRTIVVGNSVRRVLASTGRCIAVLDADDAVIGLNKVFPSSASDGIYAQGASNLVINGNSVEGNGSATYGIRVDTPQSTTITGNQVRNCTTGIRLQCTTATSLAMNILSANALYGNTTPIGTSLLGGSTFAANNRWIGNVGYTTDSKQADVLDVGNLVFHAWGAGSPEAAVTASPGSIYHRTDGGASQGLYIKESGTGNTGWVAK